MAAQEILILLRARALFVASLLWLVTRSLGSRNNPNLNIVEDTLPTAAAVAFFPREEWGMDMRESERIDGIEGRLGFVNHLSEVLLDRLIHIEFL